jgi:O-antigen ligase
MVYILILYMWLFIHRPFEVWEVLGTLRLEFCFMLVASLVWLKSGRIRWTPNALHWAYAAFALAALLCWAASPWSGEERAYQVIDNHFKVLYFYIMLVTSVRDEKELKAICLGFVGATGLYMAHSFREFIGGRHVYRMGIPRLVGVDTSLGDPNSFGASLVYALPLLVPAWHCVSGRKWRLVLIGYLGLSVLCVALTGSRSAMVALVAYFVMIVLGQKGYRLKVLVLLALACPIGWFALPEGLQNRFYSIIDPSVVDRGAQRSAEDRGEAFRYGMELWTRFPLTGCGPGVWRNATEMPIESHNLYAQVIGEMGLAGAMTMSAIVGLLLWNAHLIKKAYRDHPWLKRDFLYHLGHAIQVSVMLLLILGYGAHTLFRFNWVWYGAFLILGRRCLKERLADPAQGQPPSCG